MPVMQRALMGVHNEKCEICGKDATRRIDGKTCCWSQECSDAIEKQHTEQQQSPKE